ncbi:MAG: hypothetical protein ACK5NQ_00410 [Pseudomonas sp.]
MRRIWRKYLELLENDFCAKVFDNVKNLIACALLFAAGTSALHVEQPVLLGLWGTKVAGSGLLLISALLMFLNVSDGLHRVARLRYHLLLQLMLWAVYLIVAIRLVQLVWSFRAD